MFAQLTASLSSETQNRIVKVNDPENFDIRRVQKGIVAIHAQWSGPSIMHGKSILEQIEIIKNESVEVYIIDIDEISPETQKEKFGFMSQGYFESVWIENGSIKFTHYRNFSEFISFLAAKAE